MSTSIVHKCDGVQGRTPAQRALVGALKHLRCLAMLPVVVLEMFSDYSACSWHFSIAAVEPYIDEDDAVNGNDADKPSTETKTASSVPLIGDGVSMCVDVMDVSAGAPCVAPVGRLTTPAVDSGMMVRTRTHVFIVGTSTFIDMSVMYAAADGCMWELMRSPMAACKQQRAHALDDALCVTDVLANVNYTLDVGRMEYTAAPLDEGYRLLDATSRRACLISRDVQPPLPEELFFMDATMVVPMYRSSSFAVYLKDGVELPGELQKPDSSGKPPRSFEYLPLEKKWRPLVWPLAPQRMCAIHYDEYDETLYALVVNNDGEFVVQAFRPCEGPAGRWSQVGAPLGRAFDCYECCVYAP